MTGNDDQNPVRRHGADREREVDRRGGRPGGSPGINPDGRGTLDPSEYADTIAGGEPDPRRDPRED